MLKTYLSASAIDSKNMDSNLYKAFCTQYLQRGKKFDEILSQTPENGQTKILVWPFFGVFCENSTNFIFYKAGILC